MTSGGVKTGDTGDGRSGEGAIRVLLVDDEADARELTASRLGREDDRFEVTAEPGGAAALDRLAAEAFDCVVSDYRMAGMDGLDFLEAVREDHPDLPFVLFTDEGSEAVASDALSAGVTDYVRKKAGAGRYEVLADRIVATVERYRARGRDAWLEHVRETARRVDRALVRATSREEIETRVREIVADADPVRFVTVSGVDPATDRVVPRTWDGTVDHPRAALGHGEGTGRSRPAYDRAIATHEVTVSTDLRTDDADDAWREAVRGSGAPALVVVPLVYDGTLYGLLTIHLARAHTIGEEARTVLAELGDDVAYAINAAETRADLAEREASYRTLAETASDAIVTADATSTIRYANPAVEGLFGYSPEELRGEPLTTIMPARFHEQHLEGVARYLRTDDRRLDWTNVELPGEHRDGTEIPLAISFGEVERHGRRFFTGILRDVTERKRRTAELQRQNERLDEFAGIVAHDLRNPLNVVSGRIELARDDCDSAHLETAASALERTNGLIDDLLTLARQGQPIGETEPVSFADLSTDLVVGGDGATVEVDPALDPVVGHRTRIRELLENLVRNAIEHGDGEVTIRLEAIEGGFAVEDDGPGIPEADRADLFEPGYTTKDDGTGFGLNIVETIADAHGWEIAVTEGDEGGARFEITGVAFADRV